MAVASEPKCFTQLAADRHFQELERLSGTKTGHSNGAGLSQESPLPSAESQASPAKTKPFSDDDLKAIFENPEYLTSNCQNEVGNKSHPANKTNRP